MRIVILGAGQVGASVAEVLASEANDITIVDPDRGALGDLADRLDVRTVVGNGSLPSVLRDAGMDVIYSGLHRTPDEIVNTAIQEDVDVLGVSLLSGVQLTVFPKLFKLLAERGADDLIVIAGGVMPDEDVVAIKKMGVREVLLQDTPPQAIVDSINALVAARGPR